MNPGEGSITPSEREIFVRALEMSAPAERGGFLDDVCGDDEALRGRIERLLGQASCLGEFLENPAMSPIGLVSATPDVSQCLSGFAAEEVEQMIGRYKLLERIGEGGCGLVYVAEQQQPMRRRVALKVIKLGMDTRSVIARFEAERQALALMDHPNIAKVLDAGATESGRPYFVMELVRGIKITAFCDENHLTTRERLELFVKVCQAVQHAHQKGIIHRDLKPSNILVTFQDGVAVPKIIDFGIAKAMNGEQLTDKTIYTAFEQFIGTPAYMSPEQATMTSVDIDTRSDIYSLGVLLYELLTGKTPFDTQELLASGLDGMRKTILEKEPIRPSTRLAREHGTRGSKTQNQKSGIDRDLDWIVMKCLEKDRSRRYETANGLAMDVQRHLAHEPVVARPPSIVYQAGAFFRRHRVGVLAGSAVIAALVVGTVTSAFWAIRARASQKKAEFNEHAAVQLRQQAQAQELAARRAAYAAEMSLAYQAFESDNLGRACELLDSQRLKAADLRGWEWRSLWARTRGHEHIALRGNSNGIRAALFLRNGRTIAATARDSPLQLWNVDDRTCIATIPLRPGFQHALALSPEGRHLVVTGDRWWAVHDTVTFRAIREGSSPFNVKSAAFSPNGEWLALAADKEIQIVKQGSFEPAMIIDRDLQGGLWRDQFGLAVSPDNHSLAFSHTLGATVNGIIEVTNMLTRSAIVMRPSYYPYSLVFTRDSSRVISAGDGGIDIWDAKNGALLKTIQSHRSAAFGLALSPDGRLLASSGIDQTIRLWATDSWKEVGLLRGHFRGIKTVSFSPDGEWLVSGGDDGELRVWRTRTAPASSQAFQSSDDAPLSWPIPAGDCVVFVHGNLPYGPADLPVPEPTRVALQQLGDQGAVTYLNCLSLRESKPEKTPRSFSSAEVMAFGPGAESVAVGWLDGRIEVWRTEPFRRDRVLADSGSAAVHLSFSDSGDQLAVHRRDDSAEIWHLQHGEISHRFPPMQTLRAQPTCQFWAKDQIMTRQTFREIELWHLPKMTRKVFHQPESRDLWLFCISNNGRYLATTCLHDPLLRVRDIETGEYVMTTTGQFARYDAVTFSPDDSRLVAGGDDGTITIWDSATWQQVARWKAHKRGAVWLRFVGGDQALVSLGDCKMFDRWQGELRLWPAPALIEIEQTAKR